MGDQELFLVTSKNQRHSTLLLPNLDKQADVRIRTMIGSQEEEFTGALHGRNLNDHFELLREVKCELAWEINSPGGPSHFPACSSRSQHILTVKIQENSSQVSGSKRGKRTILK
jgi:hypothetical protein